MVAGSQLLNAADAAYPAMAQFFASDWAAFEAANEGLYVRTGGAITASATAGKLDIAVGEDLNTNPVVVPAVTAITTTITSLAHATLPKWVALEVDTSGVVQFTQGTAAANPVKPALTAARVLHGWLYIPAAATAVDTALATANGNAKLIDARVFDPTPYGDHPSAFFGDGSDGSVTFDGTTTVLGIVPSFGVYILTRDFYFIDVTLSASLVAISTAGFRIFVKGTLTANVSTLIQNNGGAGGVTAAGTAGSAGSLAGGVIGGTSTAGGAGGSAGAAPSASLGGGTGAGGAATGGPGTGGGTAGNTPTTITAAQGGPPHNALQAILGGSLGAAGWVNYTGGSGGPGGTAAAGTGTGGAGGGGGGLVMVAARVLIVATGVTLTLNANGGTGHAGVAGSSAGTGGGSGGGGGAVLLVTWRQNIIGTLTLNATGGTGGVKTGTGKNGTDGSNGNTYQVQV